MAKGNRYSGAPPSSIGATSSKKHGAAFRGKRDAKKSRSAAGATKNTTAPGAPAPSLHRAKANGHSKPPAPVATPLRTPASGGVTKRMRAVTDGDALLDSFRQRLSGSTFRLLNEQLYTTPSAFANQLMRDRSSYDDYHQGYGQQVAMWPV